MLSEEVPDAIARAFEAGRIEITRHFFDEMRADAFMLGDVRCALSAISKVTYLGEDRADHPKFEVSGPAADGRALCVVCSVKSTGAVLLITVYQGD